MAQLTYNQDLTNAFAGMLADLSPRNDVVSRISEEANDFPHGTAVVAGTDPAKQVLLPTAAATLIGVTAHTHAKEVSLGQNSNDAQIFQGDTVNVLHEGRIFVQLEDTSPAVVAGDAVFVRTANPAAGEGLGRFRGDADGGDALTLTGGRFFTGGSGGDVVQLEIDAGASIA